MTVNRESVISNLNQVAAEVTWVASELTNGSVDYDSFSSELTDRISQLQRAQDDLDELLALEVEEEEGEEEDE